MIFRDELINHILAMKLKDEAYARAALRYYSDLLPHLDLMAGVRDALKDQSCA